MKICSNFLVPYVKQGTDRWHSQAHLGFTLYELLVSMTIIGVLGAIVAPSWLHLLNSTRLDTAQSTIFQAVRTTQQKAKTSRTTWKFGIRESAGKVEWAVYQSETTPPDSLWNSLDTNIKLDDETSLKKVGSIYQVQFSYRGDVSGQLGRITLSIKGAERMKRCVIVSTLLGAIREGTSQPKLLDGKSCY